MCDPDNGVEHSGNTPGAETLIVLNGPIIKQLGFNYTQGVLRDGFLPNTSVGRFFRLYLHNIAGFLLQKTDKATFGNTWRVVVAENAVCIRALGWPSFAEDMGLAPGADSVSVANYTGGNVLANVSGDPHRHMLPYLADAVRRQISWQLGFSVGAGLGKLHPLILLTPILAETFRNAGISRNDIRQYLFDHARIPAWQFERVMGYWSGLMPDLDLAAKARSGEIPMAFGESDNPERLVPLVWKPEDFGIVVTGGAVRLTGSGLGCPTWPRCTDGSYVPHSELGVHGVVEFGNRMLTFALTAVAVACFLAALGARHRRATRLSFVIGLGIPLQAVIGGITVLKIGRAHV